MIVVWLACAFTAGVTLGAATVIRFAPRLIARLNPDELTAFASAVRHHRHR